MKVAIVGAGPGGIAAAAALQQQGFQPTLFESHHEAGGQWSASNPRSGVWPGMRTNTFLEATRFSDAEFPDGTALFPHNREVLAYFQSYARARGLLDTARFGMELCRLERTAAGYRLTFDSTGDRETLDFPRVVVATGRFNRPALPPIAGAETFTGELGITHAFHYEDPGLYRGKHVVVAGGSISALEIASDLSMLGAASVHVAQRRQRYVVPKMVVGTPIEYYAFTYGRAVLALDGSKGDVDASQARFLERCAGDPARYGAPAPHPDPSRAGTTGSQHYLPLVAEGRLTPVPWIESVSGRRVSFADGRRCEADAIIAGTGFDLDLPFLSDEIRQIVRNDRQGLELADFTFHPDLPGLAFVGLWSQQGAYPVPLEQQARYIAYTWSGRRPETEARQRAAVAACRSEGHHDGYQSQSAMALRFARLCGTDPASIEEPALRQMIDASATTGILYRLTGPDAFADGVARFREQFARYAPAAWRDWG